MAPADMTTVELLERAALYCPDGAECGTLRARAQRIREAMVVAREALIRLREVPCQTCRRDADARAALVKVAALLGQPGRTE